MWVCCVIFFTYYGQDPRKCFQTERHKRWWREDGQHCTEGYANKSNVVSMSTPCIAAKRVVNTLLERKDLLLLLQVYSIPSPKLHSVCQHQKNWRTQTNKNRNKWVLQVATLLTFSFKKQTTTILASIAIEQIGIRFRGQFMCVNNIPPNHQILCRGHYQNQAPPASTLPCADDPNSSNARALPDTILLLLIAGGWQRLCKNWLHLLVQRWISINFGKINPKACFRSMGGNIKHPCWRV